MHVEQFIEEPCVPLFLNYLLKIYLRSVKVVEIKLRLIPLTIGVKSLLDEIVEAIVLTHSFCFAWSNLRLVQMYVSHRFYDWYILVA